MAFNTTLGYTTINNKWDILTDKELAKHDLLMIFNTHKGEADYDPDFGSTILDKIFRPKSEQLKIDIQDEITEIFDRDPRLTLNSIDTEELEKGWIFYCEVSYLDGTPEEWIYEITESGVNSYTSDGSYSLGE